MEFDPNKPIYLQICDNICEQILSGGLAPESRILSVREYGASIGVNPNTVARSYEKLTDAGIIYNKRGIGYFIAEGARDLVLNEMKNEFINSELPQVIKKMKLLGISTEEFITFAKGFEN